MRYYDPNRSRLMNGRPCWLDSLIALPRFEIEPHETLPESVYLRLCHGARGIWLEKTLLKKDILATLWEWEDDPEATFMRLFGLHDWPRGLGSEPISGGRLVPFERPPVTTHERAEDLL